MAAPALIFFCELESAPLQALFADGAVLDDLRALEAGVSMGIRDLTAERAEVVRQLNQAGVPVIAWLLLPESQGYWFNLDNASEALARYAAFQSWSAEHGLRWDGIGLDIEPDMRQMRRLIGGDGEVVPTLLRQAFDSERYHTAQARYQSLVEQIHADGYRVDCYHIPFVIDERLAHTTLLQRLTGLIDLPVDRDVLMLYSSFMRPRGHAILWSYAPHAHSIAVGSTGGGVTVGGVDQIPPLTWEEFTRDLLLAQTWCEVIHVFSLEGAVREGYLHRLRTFDWKQTTPPPLAEVQTVERFRTGLRAGLWLGAHPGVILAGLGAILAGVAGMVWLLNRPRPTRRRTG